MTPFVGTNKEEQITCVHPAKRASSGYKYGKDHSVTRSNKRLEMRESRRLCWSLRTRFIEVKLQVLLIPSLGLLPNACLLLQIRMYLKKAQQK